MRGVKRKKGLVPLFFTPLLPRPKKENRYRKPTASTPDSPTKKKEMPKKACTECGQLIFVACKTCPACKAPCVASNKPKKTIAKSAKVTWAYKTHDRVQVCEYEDEELIGRVGAVRRKGLFSTSGRMRYLVRLDEVDGHAVEEDVWVGPEQLRPAPTENKQARARSTHARTHTHTHRERERESDTRPLLVARRWRRRRPRLCRRRWSPSSTSTAPRLRP